MAAINILDAKTIQAAIKTATEGGKVRKPSDGGGVVFKARPTGAGWWRLRYWIDSKEGRLLKCRTLSSAAKVRPNPLLNLTRYGKRRKPGLQHASYPCSPDLRCSPPRAG